MENTWGNVQMCGEKGQGFISVVSTHHRYCIIRIEPNWPLPRKNRTRRTADYSCETEKMSITIENSQREARRTEPLCSMTFSYSKVSFSLWNLRVCPLAIALLLYVLQRTWHHSLHACVTNYRDFLWNPSEASLLRGLTWACKLPETSGDWSTSAYLHFSICQL